MDTKIKKAIYWLTVSLCVAGIGLAGQACQDDWVKNDGRAFEVEEGIAGELTLQLAASGLEEKKVQTRTGEGEFSEQHLHSAYIFIIDKSDLNNEANCRILARKYFSDILPFVKEVTTDQQQILSVATLKMPAVSSNHAQIYAIANLGYSELQGIQNDAALLEQCDKLTNLAELKKLSVKLMVSAKNEVNVERMQGHHLMSGFYGKLDHVHYMKEPEMLILKANNGKISIHNQTTGAPYRPIEMGSNNVTGHPAALFVHRLDTKITFRIEPMGDLATTPGAYFRLQSWQVLNAPTQAELYWHKHPGKIFQTPVKNSKVFQRDIAQADDKSWTFTFYQLQNCVCTHGVKMAIDEQVIAQQYNKEFNLKAGQQLSAQDVVNSFATGNYPNDYSNFAYTLRELQEKKLQPNAPQEDYTPDSSTDESDQTITVYNGNYVYAPQKASMVRLVGRYYNPSEPARRTKDDPLNQLFPNHSLVDFPYWGENEKPVRTKEEALKRSRSATVIYYVHLGYVGGGNYDLEESTLPTGKLDLTQFKKKVNDYNVLRNHHYTYTLKVAGVENIKLEATREEHGNILHQEKQPGAEGSVLESQHFYDLDSHYETRNVTIDFTRLPNGMSKEFSFTIDTPFERTRITLKKDQHSDHFAFYDRNGNLVEDIRNHDLDWIHFAWHGTPNNPYRSLIDPQTGNGISYSQTYGGYKYQQTYLDNYLTQEPDGTHPYRLLDCLEFSELVWRLYVDWVKNGKKEDQKTVTFTMFVDENHYDFNPVTNERVNWWQFCNKPKRRALFFMEPEEISADQNSWYADAHLAVYQNSIQTLYATSDENGQVVANVAFGIEALDEFRAKYHKGRAGEHPFGNGESLKNGLFNVMNWYEKNPNERIRWSEAENYYTEKSRSIFPGNQGETGDEGGRAHRRAQWAIYSRNRDLNRNGVLDPCEIRWFVPAIDQYTLCFLGGRPVFENPLFEKDKAVKPTHTAHTWIHGVPVLHYISSSNNIGKENNQIFWAEEGCSKGNYGDANTQYLYGIRMARMLCNHGVEDSGEAFISAGKHTENTLLQDAIFTVSHTPNGQPVDYNERVDGKPYYIVINKMNVNAFRERVHVGDLAQHTHEQKANWLYRSYRIAKNKVGYTSYTHKEEYNRSVLINGIPRTWWQLNGIWSDPLNGVNRADDYYYRGPQQSLAYIYYEQPDGSDLHQWRMPNLREAAIMSMAFPEAWFDNQLITASTRSDNLGPQSTKVPFWKIKQNEIYRMGDQEPTMLFVRAIQDVP